MSDSNVYVEFSSQETSGCSKIMSQVNTQDSEATIIQEPSDVRSILSFWRDVSNKRRAIKDSIVPPVHNLEPFHDIEGQYLLKLPSYEAGIKYIAEIWKQYTTCVVLERLTLDNYDLNLPEGYRFAIHLEIDLDKNALVIMDFAVREWIHICANNNAYNDSSQFEFFVQNQIWNLYPVLKEWQGKPIFITSQVHSEYERLHLLMSLYTISRLFKYCTNLPVKVIYGESELQQYAHNICTELQLMNNEYNLKEGLINIYGYLKANAFGSMSSPL